MRGGTKACRWSRKWKPRSSLKRRDERKSNRADTQDLLPYFEALEAQSTAILQLLRDKQIATNEELDRYLDHAADASSVKWRAARVRMEHLFAISSRSAQPKTE